MKPSLVGALASALVLVGCGGERIAPGASGAGGSTFSGDGGRAPSTSSGGDAGAGASSSGECELEGADQVLCFDVRLWAFAIDSAGAFLMAGEYQGALIWGNSVLEAPDDDPVAFVGKLDANGQPLWASAYLDANQGFVRDIKLDAKGNSYITGTATRRKNPGEQTPYLAKLSPDGALVWRKIFEPSPNTFGYGAAVAPAEDGSVLLTGTGKIDVEPSDFGAPDYPVYGEGNSFAILFDPDGKAQWEHWYDADTVSFARSAAPTPDGGFVISTENFSRFGVEKLAASGQTAWNFSADGFGGVESLFGLDNGNIRAVGEFTGAANVGGVTANSGSWGPVALELDADGALLWAFTHASEGGLVVHGAATSPDGDVLLLSDIDEGTTDAFGSQTVAGEGDLWLGVVSSEGKALGATTYGSILDEEAIDLALDPTGRAWALAKLNGNDEQRTILARLSADF